MSDEICDRTEENNAIRGDVGNRIYLHEIYLSHAYAYYYMTHIEYILNIWR